MKIGFVTSSGGHLTHLLQLREFWSEHERIWVTFDTADATSALRGESVYYAFHPTNRNVFNAIRNTFLAVRVLRREHPDILISTGAGVCVPFFYIAKMFGIKVVFIEVVDRIFSATLTGRLVAPISDLVLVQWPEQLKLYPGSKLIGRII